MLLTDPACALPLKRNAEEKFNKVSWVWDFAVFLLDKYLYLSDYKARFLLGFSTGVSCAVMVITVTMATLI